MCNSSKLAKWCALLFLIASAACGPAATPVAPTATNPPPPTNTPAPTPLPTSTPRPEYTALPMPPLVIEGLFEVNGHKMNLECYGAGSPIIVLEQGASVALSDRIWDNIIPNLAVETRVCAYDRLNTGASDSIGAQTFAQATSEWQALMQAAKLEPPYIVVGHSFGGLYALSHASRYPADIVGVALVDSSHLDLCTQILAALPTPTPDDLRALTDLRDGCRTNQNGTLEGIDLDNVGGQEIRDIKSLGQVPLVVLVSAPTSKNFGGLWPGVPPAVAAKLDQVWLTAQKEYATLSSDSQVLSADHAGHFIQNDEPELVVKVIFSLLDKVRLK